MAEVVAHEALDALTRRRAAVAQDLGGALLQLMAEDVVVTLGLEMQDRSHAQQKFFGVLERARAGAALAEQYRIGQHGDRLGAEQIAQAAGRFFHVGFELIERVVEPGVALGNQRLSASSVRGRGARQSDAARN